MSADEKRFAEILKKTVVHILLICLLIVTSLQAGGRYAGASLELGLGARSLALGGAAVTLSGTIDHFFYNPSSLAFVENPSVGLMFAPTFGSISDPMANYNYIGFALPLAGGGTIAVNWTRFTVDDIPIYPDLRGNSYTERFYDRQLRPDGTALGFFRDREDVYYFSFAKSIRTVLPLGWLFIDLPIEIPFGLNLKVLRQKLYQSKASGLGFDVGTMLRFNLGTLLDNRSFGDLTLGLSMLDFTQTAIIWDTKQEDRIRRTVLFGVSYQHYLGFQKSYINFYWNRLNKYQQVNLYGAEFAMKGLSLRIGKNRSGLTAGAGFHLWRFVVDYAFVTTDFDNSHRISTTVIF